jgi:Tol biopolymer transport system component
MKVGPLVVALSLVVVAIVGVLISGIQTGAVFGLPAHVNVTMPTSLPYRAITSGTWNDRYPAWSPNGSLIAFESDRNGTWAIMVMRADGTRVKALSAPGVISMYPAWSPDSSSVSYWSYSGLSADVNVVRTSDGRTSVVQDGGFSALPGPAQWSPDGSRLLFFRTAGVAQLVLADLTSGSVRVLANVSGASPSASWINGTSILYTTASVNGTGIYQLDLTSASSAPFLVTDGSNYVTPSVGFNSTVAYFTDEKPAKQSTHPYVSYAYGYDIWVRTVANSTATFQYWMAEDSYRSGVLMPVPYVPGVMDMRYAPKWNNNATKLVYNCDSLDLGVHVYMWDVVNWTTVPLGPAAGCNVVEPTWSPDGSNVAFSSNLGGFYHIWVTSILGITAMPATGGY